MWTLIYIQVLYSYVGKGIQFLDGNFVLNSIVGGGGLKFKYRECVTDYY